MHVTGFSFIRNAIKYDYPVVEAIQSILPLCDDFVVAVGNSDDETLQLIESLDHQKIKIIQTIWDDTLRKEGKVLAVETDKAFQAISEKADWCIYIQGDEVLHEKYHDSVKSAMEQYAKDDRVDGLLFDYLHFYGSYDYIATSSAWYKHEVRVIRNNKSIYSYRDAQGFRKNNNEVLNVKPVKAVIHHYGWVKPPVNMQLKQKYFQKLWHNDEWVREHVSSGDEFDYSEIDRLEVFKGSHPKVMQERIKRLNWRFSHDISRNKISVKDRLKHLAKKYLGKDFSYRNYRII
ncbi:MAG: glycosyltransferase family 2 protein [Saprospiraceae bacterium]|jgi:hypothetical protein|nr:glycosyltransferase family 2 protein [Saprospiraceae bacterium]